MITRKFIRPVPERRGRFWRKLGGLLPARLSPFLPGPAKALLARAPRPPDSSTTSTAPVRDGHRDHLSELPLYAGVETLNFSVGQVGHEHQNLAAVAGIDDSAGGGMPWPPWKNGRAPAGPAAHRSRDGGLRQRCRCGRGLAWREGQKGLTDQRQKGRNPGPRPDGQPEEHGRRGRAARPGA